MWFVGGVEKHVVRTVLTPPPPFFFASGRDESEAELSRPNSQILGDPGVFSQNPQHWTTHSRSIQLVQGTVWTRHQKMLPQVYIFNLHMETFRDLNKKCLVEVTLIQVSKNNRQCMTAVNNLKDFSNNSWGIWSLMRFDLNSSDRLGWDFNLIVIYFTDRHRRRGLWDCQQGEAMGSSSSEARLPAWQKYRLPPAVALREDCLSFWDVSLRC